MLLLPQGLGALITWNNKQARICPAVQKFGFQAVLGTIGEQPHWLKTDNVGAPKYLEANSLPLELRKFSILAQEGMQIEFDYGGRLVVSYASNRWYFQLLPATQKHAIEIYVLGFIPASEEDAALHQSANLKGTVGDISEGCTIQILALADNSLPELEWGYVF
jgi:hypothetical protein